MLYCIGEDSYTSFYQELLNSTVDTPSLNLSPTITKYRNNLKQIKKNIRINTNKHIPLKEYKQDLRSERK